MSGKLIVIEGTDASGKHTQSVLLYKRLKKEGKKAVLVSFPRYSTPYGKTIKEYLHGEFGNPHSLPPEFCALLYAQDREDARSEIESKLRKGYTVICDRYVQANAAHQAAKLTSLKRQKHFIKWIFSIERKMPKASRVIFIDLPIELSSKLMKGRKRKKDAHESNLAYLKRTRKVFKMLAKENKWTVINAYKRKGKKLIIKSRAEVHSEICSELKK